MLGNKKTTAVLPATDLKRARNFYTEKLGLKVLNEYPSMLVLGAGEGTMFTLYKRPDTTKAEHTVLSFSVQDIEEEVSKLKAGGVIFEEYDMPEVGVKTENGIAVSGGWKSAWLKDSEGNIIGLSQM